MARSSVSSVDSTTASKMKDQFNEMVIGTGIPRDDLMVTPGNKYERPKLWQRLFHQAMPKSEKIEVQGEQICICPTFANCTRTATLHADRTCDFCYGLPSDYFPKGKLYRYYPCDSGWDDLRSIAVVMRSLGGQKPPNE